jgi:hypothetical protein
MVTVDHHPRRQEAESVMLFRERGDIFEYNKGSRPEPAHLLGIETVIENLIWSQRVTTKLRRTRTKTDHTIERVSLDWLFLYVQFENVRRFPRMPYPTQNLRFPTSANEIMTHREKMRPVHS